MRRPAPETERELVVRAEALAGHDIGEIACALELEVPADTRHSKGFVGRVIEDALGADPRAGDGPDLPHLGIELKTVPVDRRGRPAESTFVCSIGMAAADREQWESSRLRRRLRRVLWVPVDAARVAPLAARRVHAPVLWSPGAALESLLRADWEDLMGAIGAGRGGSLSAREGRALQVRPKAATARVRTLAPGPDGPQRALPLGFYLRAELVAGVLGERSSG
jgi:DNA mismatch repair protein MutH